MSQPATAAPSLQSRLDPSISLPLLWIAVVLFGTIWYGATGGAASRPVLQDDLFRFLSWQSAIVAGTVLSANAWNRRRRVLSAFAGVIVLGVVAFSLVALPLNLYACSEWVTRA